MFDSDDKSIEKVVLRECCSVPSQRFVTDENETDGERFWKSSNGCHDIATGDCLSDKHSSKAMGDFLEDARSNSNFDIEQAEDLGAICRYLLRIGAWRALSVAVDILINKTRHAFPTPFRLSIATGLITEWSLSSANGKLAILYASECLAWGHEVHRIRSYLAYAHLLMGAPRDAQDEMNLFLSRSSVLQHAILNDRKAFNQLHQYRTCLLSNSMCNTEESEELYAICNERVSPNSETVFRLATLARWACATEEITLDGEIVSFLLRRGRWRDLLIAECCKARGVTLFNERQREWIRELDALAKEFPIQNRSAIDRHYTSQLPRAPIEIRIAPNIAKMRLLCCI
jgi:hypothetical protein